MKPSLLGMILVALATVLALYSCAAGEKNARTPARAPAVGMGKQFYMQYCSACHGADAAGGGPVAAVLKIAPPDLTRITERKKKFNVLEIAAFIDGRTEVRAHGKQDMPVWGKRLAGEYGDGPFREEMIEGTVLQLVKYLESLQR